MFTDRVRIRVSGGDGGKGCCSFRREKFEPRGGPNGGDGGNGGDVRIVATSRLSTLNDLRYHAHITGDRGQHGHGSNRHGSNGQPVEIAVPLGTVVRDFQSGDVLADLTQEGESFTAAEGGRGGKGNARFATSTNRAPHFAELGEPGQEQELLLELKTLAEVGLVGLPNAGKSTLLASVSRAKPKIADYPFTTLSPHLGMVDLPDFRSFTLADIPGIIEGAAEGKGLGHDFLRHIERTRVLLFLVDLGDSSPRETVRVLENELAEYSEALADRPRVYGFTKMDITENRERCEEIAGGFANACCISAVTGAGLSQLLELVWARVEQARREEEAHEDEPDLEQEYTYEAPFEIAPEGEGFRVSGKRPVRAVRMTDFDNAEAVRHLQDILGRMGLFKALQRMGAREGQSIYIGEIELEYSPEQASGRR